jgi:hypothetical protein
MGVISRLDWLRCYTGVLQELDRAFRQAAEQQLKRAEGDFSPDPKANRFPALTANVRASARGATEGLGVRALFKLRERDHVA